jgi:hypothetical protein
MVGEQGEQEGSTGGKALTKESADEALNEVGIAC